MNKLSIVAPPALVAITALALCGCGATAKPKAEARAAHNPMEITPVPTSGNIADRGTTTRAG